MESLPQVSTALEHILTEVADEAAVAVGFVRRRRVLTGAVFVQALVLGWLARPQATLHQLTQTLAAPRAAISPQGLAQRFGPEAAALLERVLAAAVAAPMRGDPGAIPLLARFAGGVWVLDCTTVRLPDALAAVWRGCGGRTGRGTQAALKLQVRLDLAGGGLEGPLLLDGRTQDKAGPLHAAPLPPDALSLTDLGFWSLERLRAIGAAGAFWLSRLDPHTHVFTPDGERRELPRWLARGQTATVEADVRLGARARLPARLVAARAPKAVADARRRKLRAAAKREGKAPPQATLALAGWTVYVTNVPPARLSLPELFVLGRARWQIELLFKLWKQEGRLDESRSADPWRVLCEVYAKLIALLIQHWLLLVGCWDQPARSLVRAAQTVQAHAICLLRSLAHPARLLEEVTAIARCIAAGCRVAKRAIRPSAFQLWHDPALGGLT
jgi:Transposase DDE domain